MNLNKILIKVILLFPELLLAQNSPSSQFGTNDSLHYYFKFISDFQIYYKYYHRKDGDIIYDSTQFFDLNDSNLVSDRDISISIFNGNGIIYQSENNYIDKNNIVLSKRNYNSYSISDSTAFYNYYCNDTLCFLIHRYFNRFNRNMEKNVDLFINGDTSDVYIYNSNGNKFQSFTWYNYDTLSELSNKLIDEFYYYKNDLIDYEIRNSYNENLLINQYKNYYIRDHKGQLIRIEENVYDSSTMSYVNIGIRYIFGTSQKSIISEPIVNQIINLISNGTQIIWDKPVLNNSLLSIIDKIGKTLYTFKLQNEQTSIQWPSFLPMGEYIVSLRNLEEISSKMLVKK